MKKWIILSVILILLNSGLVIKLKQMEKVKILRASDLSLLKSNRGDNLFLLILFFSQNDCASCLEEVEIWNRIEKDFKNKIKLIGIIPEEEDIEFIKENLKVNFKLIKDKKNYYFSKFNIPFTPFKILCDPQGNILYASRSSDVKELQEKFYFEIGSAILEKAKIESLGFK